MVFKRTSIKRKRKAGCTSPLLDDSPKRTKVHAQRKFAQGSNINSPVITPIKELESEIPTIDVMPEPVELLPIKRPNTEDFLTFLCFRGTPILPPNLNFFNTASIVDTNGQVHEIKSESPKNGPIDIAKCGTSSEKPFIAFGVRKRADPIVISRQMDKKRRHALALQALRRKYQEQKMAKIRALTISKLSEKVTNKTLVRTNTVSKTETVTKKSNTLQKTKVVATKHVKVTTQTLKTTLRPKIKPKMCLRSFQGRFVQKELPFRKRVVPEKKIIKKPLIKKVENKKKKDEVSDSASENEESPITPVKENCSKPAPPKIIKKPTLEPSSRITRSGLSNNKINVRRQQIKKIMLLSTPNTTVKPRSLRSTTMKKTVLSQRKSRTLKSKQKLRAQQRLKNLTSNNKTEKSEENKTYNTQKTTTNTKKDVKPAEKKNVVKTVELKKEINKSTDIKKSTDVKKEYNKTNDKDKKVISKTIDVKKEISKSIDIKKEISKIVDTKKYSKKSIDRTEANTSKNVSTEGKSSEVKKELKNIEVAVEKSVDVKKLSNPTEKNKKETNKSTESPKRITNKLVENKKLIVSPVEKLNKKNVDEIVELDKKITDKAKKPLKNDKQNVSKKDDLVKKDLPELVIKKDTNVKEKKLSSPNDVFTKKDVKKETSDSGIKKDNKSNINKIKKEPLKKEEPIIKKEDVKKKITDVTDEEQIPKMAQRPSRKTKEAAAIYMEILSHKLVNESKIDDDNISIDSFPELPNVKKTEQRENELKAQAKSTKDDTKEKPKIVSGEIENDNKSLSTLVEDTDITLKHLKVKSTSSGLPLKKNVEKADKSKLRKSNNEDTTSEDTKLTKVAVTSQSKEKSPEPTRTVEALVDQIIKSDGKLMCKKQPEAKKMATSKRKPTCEVNTLHTSDSENEVKKTKIKKPDGSKPLSSLSDTKNIKKDMEKSDKDVTKRQTRNSSQANKKDYTDDSDESFHIDIKVPRKKKLTRSKVLRTQKNESTAEKSVDATKAVALTTKNDLKTKNDGVSSSDSDHSTTSDVNLQVLVNKAKNKKFSKTKSMKKADTAFSDSDEEPLSKLTSRSIEGSQKSTVASEKVKDKCKQDIRSRDVVKSIPKTKNISKAILKPQVTLEVESIKPKRECAKRPQNYLPMLSSSDEDDIFHGFDEKKEEKISKPVPLVEPSCIHAPPLIDLLNKDVGRRFGKEKVNMSNEQIEKWLKDSALAGSSIKKENDEMLKFGERIPTETTLESAEHIDTQNLKSSLLETNVSKKEGSENISAVEESNTTPIKSEKTNLHLSIETKPQTTDRKLIFRKIRNDSAPNVNAFSPENESSVYAFGEENEDLISTPFRRPSRRPSSTATSRSEDESSRPEDSLKAGHFRKPPVKQEISKGNKDESDGNLDTDDNSHHFYIPQKPTKHNFPKLQPGGNLQKTKSENKTAPKTSKSSDRLLETDDFKYKIPSSPSASSSSSAKLYKRQTQKQKIRPPESVAPIYVSDFPKKSEPAKLVEAPVFHPTDQEFQDPLEYIERIRHKAEQFGICRIVPPNSFKPECKVTDDMRFTAYNQYVHKMLHRWGPNFKELMAIRKYLETQNISLTHPPWIGGMEIDLPRLYQTVQTLGGLKEVIEKKKWPRVSELMKIPKSAQDRVTKLDDIYCKYLLPYDTLSPAEREKLFDEVETEWAKRESKGLLKAQQKFASQDTSTEGDSEPDDNDVEECITKGRNIALNAFYRIARNTMSMFFKTAEPAALEVEQEYWKHVTMKQNHICVHSGSIDSGNWGYGFAVSKNSPFARHSWNLKILTNNNGSVLRSLGPIMGVTVPTLHVGMVFSACCWYRDPHGLPWIEYLHTGGSKIWYGIPNSTSDLFHSALKKLVPNYCKNKMLWLPSDTVMVPPGLLVENKVSLCRTVQDPGQFIIVFPKAFTSSISTGYVVSESVYFAPPYWLKTARGLFDDLKNSREPPMFSLDRLLLSIASDTRCSPEILRQVIPHVQELCDSEKAKRNKLYSFGSMETEKMPLPEANSRKRKKLQGEEGDYECEFCRMNLFVSMVFDTQEAVTYCLDHGIEMIEKKKSLVANCKFMFTYDDNELSDLPHKIQVAIEHKQQKRIPNKYTGLPTLLNK